MTVAITRQELDAAGLRGAAVRCRAAKAARRMLALTLVMEGGSREEAARCAGMERQTLRDWVHRSNEEGLAGLYDRQHPGPKPRLTPEQEAELAAVVERGPDPEHDGVVRWRRVDLQALIKDRFEVSCPSAPWASCCAGWALLVCRCAPSIRRAIYRRKSCSKKLR